MMVTQEGLMAYSIKEFAELAGVSVKTLRHYDRLGLLCPQRQPGNAYRVYGAAEVALLQQILLYKELGLPLKDIGAILKGKGFDPLLALNKHLVELKEKQARLAGLIAMVEKSISAREGKMTMSDKDQFEGFKTRLVAENEARYGREIREKYGEEAVAESNAKLMGMTEAQYEASQALSLKVNRLLEQAVKEGDPRGATARELCQAHKEWLMHFWKAYSREAHKGLGEMYAADERFAKYYNDIVPGGAVFLRDALAAYCG